MIYSPASSQNSILRYFICFASNLSDVSGSERSEAPSIPVVVLEVDEVAIEEALEATSVRLDEKIDCAIVSINWWLVNINVLVLPVVLVAVVASVGDRLKALE